MFIAMVLMSYRPTVSAQPLGRARPAEKKTSGDRILGFLMPLYFWKLLDHPEKAASWALTIPLTLRNHGFLADGNC